MNRRHEPYPPPTPVWRAATDIGRRDDNEDRFEFRHGVTLDPAGDHPVAVVCDGLGGHTNGALAAERAATAFMDEYLKSTPPGAGTPLTAVASNLHRALRAASDGVFQENEALGDFSGYPMASTLTAAAVTTDGLHWINVGDSPIFHFSRRTGVCREIGKRHNLYGQTNHLASVLMSGDSTLTIVSSSECPTPFEKDDAFILASDGIDTLEPDEIAEIAAASNPGDDLARDLVEAALSREIPRQDNVTVVTLDASRLNDLPATAPRGIVCGRRYEEPSGADGVEVTVDGRPLDWKRSLALHNHSPSGPEWGYRGSGPAQLALAVLQTLTGGDGKTAVNLHQRFKEAFLADISEDAWSIPTADIRRWIEETGGGAR